MALRQGQQKEEDIDLFEDIREHWRQPKLLLSRFQTWVTHQPIAVEALVATLAGSGHVRSPIFFVGDTSLR
jgi:hypothetical protein